MPPHAGAVPGQGYPSYPPYPPQPGMAWGPRPPRGPSRGLGVFKLLIGLALAGGLFVALLVEGHEGVGPSLLMGLVMGVGLRWIGTGAANVAGKRIPLVPSLAVPVIGAVIGAAAGPALSGVYWRGQESVIFDRCLASGNRWTWEFDYLYDIPEQFQRPEAKAHCLKAAVQDALRDKDYGQVRLHMGTVRREHAGDANFDMVLAEASRGLNQAYEEALQKLNKPGEADEDAEFAVDEELRRAFAVLLKELSTSESADVYVAFSNAAELAEPQGHEARLNLMKQEESVKRGFPDGKVKIIREGAAFSPKYDNARRNTFLKASSDAFRQVFDANLLSLKALPESGRRNLLVLEVASLIRRTPTYFNYYETNPKDQLEYSKGLLFGINVTWTFKVFDRQGKELYASQTVSEPAKNISLIDTPGAPEWSVYSILMDSAYYNYSRRIIGQFGLKPPPEKRAFGYKAAGG
jgi:hypothetical protein